MGATTHTEISGKTKRFSGNGRGLGYPTANINTDVELIDGVYLGYASLGEFKDNPAMIFVGIPATVGDKVWRVEAHLLDIPDQDYYDLPISARLIHYIRPNQTFASVNKLQEQMKDDEAYARKYFKGAGPYSTIIPEGKK